LLWLFPRFISLLRVKEPFEKDLTIRSLYCGKWRRHLKFIRRLERRMETDLFFSVVDRATALAPILSMIDPHC
jgi:hypothetical protein